MHSSFSRREFLRRTAWGAALTPTVPAFVAATFDQLHASADTQPTAALTGRDAPILVVLQLAGGNDGLNMLAPFDNDDYRRARPKLGLDRNHVLKLNDGWGLHPSLAGCKQLWDDGHLGIIQAVGYPNPNRSHFRSTDIWMTGSDSQTVSSRGWLGGYFDHACAGAEPTVGLAVSRQMPLAFAAESHTGIAVENPDSLRFTPGSDDSAGPDETTAAYRQVSEGGMTPHEESAAGGSIATLPGSSGPKPSPLDFLQRTAISADLGSSQIRKAAAKGRNTASYPASALANDLRLVARLIAGGLPARVYYVSQGGYDTHTNQLPTHQRLCNELGGSLAAFLADLKAAGALNRVLVMTFSEFGRRVAENASGGTDHGAAAPLLLAGGAVRPGLSGAAPSLAPADLLNGDVRHRVDFREVYAGVLEKWLGTPSLPILGRAFTPYPVVTA